MSRIAFGLVALVLAACGEQQTPTDVRHATTAMPTRVEVMNMPAEERTALRERMMREALSAPDTVMSEGFEAQRDPVSAGRFTDADFFHKGRGNVSIHKLDDGSYVLRLTDFRVTRGPALVVVMARHRAPQNAADVEEGYIKVGDLKGNVGDQNYRLPANLDVTTFGSVVIWCELFDVMFSAAPLSLL